MATQIGRLRTVGFAKRGTTIPTVPIVSGTFLPPDNFVRFLPPWAWYPAQPPLESAAISARRELPIKAVKGPGTVGPFKSNSQLEPTDVFGHLHLAGFGLDTLTGDGIADPHAHNFEVLESAVLPTYDYWHDEGDKQFGFAAMMANKFDLIMPKAEVVRLETEWIGLYYVDALALTPTVVYPAQRPLSFAQVDVSLGGTASKVVSNAQITLTNAVVADATLRSDSNFPARVWTEHALVECNWEMFFEDAVEYNKFLAYADPATPTPSSFRAKISSSETFIEGALPPTKYSFDYLIGNLVYRTAEVELPSGVIKVKFTAVGLPFSGTIGAGGNAYIFTDRNMVAQFINGNPVLY